MDVFRCKYKYIFLNPTNVSPIAMSQLYELSDDPQRKEFLDDLFAFMQKRGEYTFAYSFARIYSHITSLDYYVDRLPVTPGCPSSDGCFHRHKPSTLEQAANDS